MVAGEIGDRFGSVKRTFATILIHGGPSGMLTRAHRCDEPQHPGVRQRRRAPAGRRPRPGRGAVADRQIMPRLRDSCRGTGKRQRPPRRLSQIRSCLLPDGLFLAAALGGDTLKELRAAWIAAESELLGGVSPRVSPFVHVREWGTLLQRAGFALPVADANRHIVRYDNALALMREVKLLGLSSALIGRRRAPATRSLLTRVAEHYALQDSDGDGRIRATFEIVFLTGWSPHESQQQPLRPGSAKARLADALGVEEKPLKR